MDASTRFSSEMTFIELYAEGPLAHEVMAFWSDLGWYLVRLYDVLGVNVSWAGVMRFTWHRTSSRILEDRTMQWRFWVRRA